MWKRFKRWLCRRELAHADAQVKAAYLEMARMTLRYYETLNALDVRLKRGHVTSE